MQYQSRSVAMQAGDLGRLIVLAALWGGSFLFIRVAAPVLGPIVLVELRVLIAGLALLIYVATTRRAIELRARWRQYLIIGALNSALPFVLISTAELRLIASFAAILNATSPLFGAIIAAVWLKDTLTARKIGGLILGIAGVATLVGWSPISLSAGVLLLALGSTALAYLLYFRLIIDIGPARALTVTFITPIFGVAWGALFLGEQIAIGTVVGCVIILAGTALVLGLRIRPIAATDTPRNTPESPPPNPGAGC